MTYTLTRDESQSPRSRWKVTEAERWKKHLLELPTGEFVNPRLIEMIRCTAGKADRSTGEIGAAVHIECKGSWFTVKFDEVDEARGFARCVADFRDEFHN